MKKSLFLFALFASLTFVPAVFAHNNTVNLTDVQKEEPKNYPSVRLNKLQNFKRQFRIKAHRQQLIQAKKQQLRGNLKINKKQVRRELLVKHAKRLNSKAQTYNNRLNRLIEKLQKYIDILDKRGININDAQQSLDETKSKLEQSKVVMEEAVSQFKLLGSETEVSTQTLSNAKKLAEEAHVSFKDTVQSLKNTLRIIKALSVPHSVSN